MGSYNEIASRPQFPYGNLLISFGETDASTSNKIGQHQSH